MYHSSRKNPCPVCARDTDDKCRWSDEFILCYQGSRFHPPDYRLGEVVHLPDWPEMACTSLSAGFSGQHLLLTPNRPLEGHTSTSQEDREERLRQVRQARAEAERKIKTIRAILRKLQKTPDLTTCRLDQILLFSQASDKIYATALELKTDLRINRIRWAGIEKLFMLLDDSLKQSFYMHKDAALFIKQNLMT